MDGDGPRNTESLLLPAGESQRRFVQAVLEFIPDSDLAQGGLYNLIQFAGLGCWKTIPTLCLSSMALMSVL